MRTEYVSDIGLTVTRRKAQKLRYRIPDYLGDSLVAGSLEDGGSDIEYSNLEDSETVRFARHRFAQNRDVKYGLDSHGYTGLGKTTKATYLCGSIDPHWNEYYRTLSTLDGDEYLWLYDNVKPRSAILFDELEREADSRRSMSNKNVELFKKLQTARYRNIATVFTFPYLASIDKRMPQLSDMVIWMDHKGVGKPFYLNKRSRLRSDGTATMTIYPTRILDESGREEYLFWGKRSDEVIDYLDELKRKADQGEDDSRIQRMTSKQIQALERDAKRDGRDEVIVELIDRLRDEGTVELTKRQDIADIIDVTRETTYNIENRMQA